MCAGSTLRHTCACSFHALVSCWILHFKCKETWGGRLSSERLDLLKPPQSYLSQPARPYKIVADVLEDILMHQKLIMEEILMLHKLRLE